MITQTVLDRPVTTLPTVTDLSLDLTRLGFVRVFAGVPYQTVHGLRGRRIEVFQPEMVDRLQWKSAVTQRGVLYGFTLRLGEGSSRWHFTRLLQDDVVIFLDMQPRIMFCADMTRCLNLARFPIGAFIEMQLQGEIMPKQDFERAAKAHGGQHKAAVEAMMNAIASATTPAARLSAAVGAHISTLQAMQSAGASAADFFSGLEALHENKQAIQDAIEHGL